VGQVPCVHRRVLLEPSNIVVLLALLFVLDSSKTTAPSKSGTDTCMSDVVMPCMQANDLTLMTMSSKDCLAAAMSGISVCANEACFKTMYDFCQSLA